MLQVGAQRAEASPATFEVLGSPDGPAWHVVRGVSADGTRVVGGRQEHWGSAYWWDAEGEGHFGVPYADSDFEVMLAVSADGVWAVGYDYYDPILQAGEYMLWNLETQTAIALDQPAWDGSNGWEPKDAAYAMTPDAAIVVGQAGGIATIWPAGGEPLAIPTEHPATARGVSADGTRVVGHSQWLTWDPEYNSTLWVSGFLWTQSRGTIALPEPMPGQGHYVFPVAISADGSTIVGYTIANDDEGHAALVRWVVGPDDEVAAAELLSPMTPGFWTFGTIPPFAAVSADGTVVGGVVGIDAAIWRQAEGLATVAELAALSGIDLGALHPYALTAMTPDGTVLVGEGLECDPTDPECNSHNFPSLGWRLDLAPASCGPDLDCDGAIDGADLGILLAAWGSRDPHADLDDSGIVDGADLGMLLAAWSAEKAG